MSGALVARLVDTPSKTVLRSEDTSPPGVTTGALFDAIIVEVGETKRRYTKSASTDESKRIEVSRDSGKLPAGRATDVVQSGSTQFRRSGQDKRLRHNHNITQSQMVDRHILSMRLYVHVQKREGMGNRGALIQGVDDDGR